MLPVASFISSARWPRTLGCNVETSAYDEQRVLAQYLWHNYANLFPSEHREVMKALIGDAKASVARDSLLVNRIRMIFGSTAAGKVAEQLSDGESAFQKRACEQLLTNHPSEIAINRCPRCTRIVRTPEAKQCLWCGHDWHAA